MAEHTPTPWSWSIGVPGEYRAPGASATVHPVGKLGTIALTTAANAALIVRAVNSHAALVEALKGFLVNPEFKVWVGGNPNAVKAMLDKAEAALKLAEEGQ